MKFNLNNMFGNKSKELSYTQSSYNEEARAPVRSTNNPQDKILTLLSDGCKFEGNLSSPSPTKIEGHVVGNVRGESGIIIGEKGIVEGNINAVDVIIYGTVKGKIKAHKLDLKRTCSLNGDIVVEELATETGSKFNGNCKMGEIVQSNIIDMKETEIEIQTADTQKEKQVLKFH